VYEFAYNSSTHHTTGVVQFQVVYGEVSPSSLQLVNPGKSRSKTATQLADLLINTRRAVHDALSESARRYTAARKLWKHVAILVAWSPLAQVQARMQSMP